MSHNLFAVFPLPVVLAFFALILLLLPIARVLRQMGKPVPVRIPVREAPPAPAGRDLDLDLDFDFDRQLDRQRG